MSVYKKTLPTDEPADWLAYYRLHAPKEVAAVFERIFAMPTRDREHLCLYMLMGLMSQEGARQFQVEQMEAFMGMLDGAGETRQ
jgi:hypothetical protein